MATSTSGRWSPDVAVAEVEPAAQDAPAAERGRLVIHDTALEHTARIAASRASGVVRRTGKVERLVKGSGPSVDLRRSGDRLRARVAVSLAWPEPIAETARAVRDDVTTTLARVSGMTVEAVDVTVTHIETTDRRTS